jgi:hypothetical protein
LRFFRFLSQPVIPESRGAVIPKSREVVILEGREVVIPESRMPVIPESRNRESALPIKSHSKINKIYNFTSPYPLQKRIRAFLLYISCVEVIYENLN